MKIPGYVVRDVPMKDIPLTSVHEEQWFNLHHDNDWQNDDPETKNEL
jgi:hypothetical protein